jgi:hypothetical protein
MAAWVPTPKDFHLMSANEFEVKKETALTLRVSAVFMKNCGRVYPLRRARSAVNPSEPRAPKPSSDNVAGSGTTVIV